MKLEYDSTLTAQQMDSLAQLLAQRQLPVIQRFEPIADFEELFTFVSENPTPIGPTGRNRAWHTDAVATRLIEAIGIAAHEPMVDTGWHALAQIIVEHAEYLYTYHHSPYKHERLQGGAALALIGGVCHILPQSTAWRFVGFARILEVISDPNLSPKSHITDPIDGAFALSAALNLEIPGEAIDTYNAVLNRNFQSEKQSTFAFSEHNFWARLEGDYPELQTIKSELDVGNLEEAKEAYTAFQRRKTTDKCTLDNATSYLAAVRLRSALCAAGQEERPKHSSPHVSHLMVTGDIGIAASLFPEVWESQQHLKFALRRFQWLFDTHFYPDGFHIDGATGSHYLAFTGIANFYHFAQLAGLDLPRAFHDGFERIIEVLMHLSQPDYSLPPLGDTALSDMRVSEPCRIGYQAFHRADFLFMASKGAMGTPPHETSYAFPNAGYHIMREGWCADAQYLVAAKRNFSLYAHQRALIVDSWIRLPEEVPTATDSDTRWLTTPTFDFVESWYKGEESDTANHTFHHKRSIFYVKGDYFILHNLVLGEGTHQLEQIFQLAPVQEPSTQLPDWRPGRMRVEGGARVRTIEPDLGNIVIDPVDTTELKTALQCNDKTGVIPLTYTANRTLPAVMNIILFPLPPQTELTPEIEPIEVKTDADVLATGFSLSHSGHRDIALISDDGFATMSTSDVTFVGEYLLLRLNQKQETEWIVMINGQFLAFNEQVVVDLPEPEELISFDIQFR